MTDETLKQENERLRKEVEKWTGMYRIAASRADAAEASNSHMLFALHIAQSSSPCPLYAEAIQSADVRKK